MAYTYTENTGLRREFQTQAGFIAQMQLRAEQQRGPVIVEACGADIHMTELVCIDMQPVAPKGAAGAFNRLGG